MGATMAFDFGSRPEACPEQSLRRLQGPAHAATARDPDALPPGRLAATSRGSGLFRPRRRGWISWPNRGAVLAGEDGPARAGPLRRSACARATFFRNPSLELGQCSLGARAGCYTWLV